MAVDVERERNRRVAEDLLDELRVRSGGQLERRVAVPEIVEPDPSDVAHAVARTDSRGTRITKESKHSTRRIDLAVAAVMAHARAAELAHVPAVQVF